jgi:hypothetical protein
LTRLQSLRLRTPSSLTSFSTPDAQVKHNGVDRNYKSGSRLKRLGWADVAAIAILIFLIIQLISCSYRTSATYDEQYHIANGLNFLRRGDPGLIPEHPPLIDLITALPLLADRDLVLPPDYGPSHDVNSLTFSDQLVWKLNPNGPSIIARARVPIMALTIFLALIVFAWARELYGSAAALVALTLLAFDPNILAHGCLATNDIGVTCFVTISLYAFWRWRRAPGIGKASIAGLAFGLAQISKFSALFLVPVILITLFADWVSNKSNQTDSQLIRHTVRDLTVGSLVAAVTIWAGCGFQMGTLKGFPVPARAYLTGLQALTHLVENGKASFLLGTSSDSGWWYYFPIAFAVKTPLPTLLLIVCSLVYVYRVRTWRAGLPLLLPVLIYFGASMVSHFNIGYRHLLPVLPLIFIFVGQLARIEWRPLQKQAWAICLAVVWLVIGSRQTYPHYLTFFNEVVGGPTGGQRVLLDSNLNWGQELIELRDYLAREKIDSIKLSYLGTADPGAYGIMYEPLPSFPYHQWKGDNAPENLLNPPNGIYAISVSNLQGFTLENHDLYARFRERKPDAIVGHSIFIYRIFNAVKENVPRSDHPLH